MQTRSPSTEEPQKRVEDTFLYFDPTELLQNHVEIFPVPSLPCAVYENMFLRTRKRTTPRHLLCLDGLGLCGLDVLDVEGADDTVRVVEAEGTDIGELLDLGGASLDLLVGHLQAELLDARLDGVPAGDPAGEGDVAGEAEPAGVDDLVCAGVVEDGLGVDAGLVGEGAEAGDGVVEGDVLAGVVSTWDHGTRETGRAWLPGNGGVTYDLDGVGDKGLELLELVQLVAGLDVVGGGHDHAGHEATQGGDAVALACGVLVSVCWWFRQEMD